MLNAGVLIPRALQEVTESLFDEAYNLNVNGPLFLVQKSVPHMPAGGRIIFVSSGTTRGSTVPDNYVLYTSTKGAVEQTARVLAKELGARDNITVNAVAPGLIATEFFFKGKRTDLVEAISSQSPFRCLGTTEEAANAVVFIASHESSWISGQIIGVNGASFV